MYCLFVNANSNDNKIASINNQYHLQWICNGQYCIATLKTTADYYIPPVQIEVFKLIPNIHIYGVLLCIRETNILYIPFDKCTKQEIDTLLPRLDKFNLKGIKIHIVCVGYNKIRPIKSLETWIYHKLDIREFCLNYNMNFHIVVNSHYEEGTRVISIMD